ncbi:MAG TPA: hypothetical protein VF982_02475 [Anaerolineales bacterium]
MNWFQKCALWRNGLADSNDKQVLRFAQNDRAKYFSFFQQPVKPWPDKQVLLPASRDQNDREKHLSAT